MSEDKSTPGFEADERGIPKRQPRNAEELATLFEDLRAAVYDSTAVLGIEDNGYGKCVEAMWRFAYAAHDLMAAELGVTGFQHGASSLRLLGRLRGIQGPYMLLSVENALYPQYDIAGDAAKFLVGEDVRHWLAERAAQQLAKYEAEPTMTYANSDGEMVTASTVAPRVVDHWRALVAAGQAAGS